MRVMWLVLGLVAATQHRGRENPISKVVNLLQGLKAEVEHEGEAEEDAFKKYMCYCDRNDGQLKAEVDDGQAHINELESLIAELTASNGQMEQDIKDHDEDISENNQAVQEATKVREKEAGEFAAEAEDLSNSVDALSKAIPAIQAGSGGTSLLELTSDLAVNRAARSDRNQLLIRALLEENDETKGSGVMSAQVLGILEQMQDNFKEDLLQAQEAEKDAAETFAALQRAKAQEISSSTTQRDDKKARVADQKLTLASAKEDLEDTTLALANDQEFASTLAASCKSKSAEWDERQQTRGQELVAIQSTIKMLNEDDSRDLFKATLSAPALPQVSEGEDGFSFMQTRSRSMMRARMHTTAKAAMQVTSAIKMSSHDRSMSAIAASMRSAGSHGYGPAYTGKFAEIKTMVNEMIGNLGKEQEEDDKHRSYCEDESSKKTARRTKLTEELDLLGTKVSTIGQTIKTIDDDMQTLKTEISNLDQSVADGTNARKSEHQESVSTATELQAAIDLLHKAKDRLSSFYAPKPEPVKAGFLGLGADFMQMRMKRTRDIIDDFMQVGNGNADAQAGGPQTKDREAAPETFGGEYKKNGAGTGVLALLDNLVHDCQMQMQEGKHTEGEAQRNYEALMKESQAAREAKAHAIADKEIERVRYLEVLGEAKEEKTGSGDELTAINQNLAALHDSCDFLVNNYDFRKKARSDELDGLKQGLATLAGADLGLSQGGSPSVPVAFLRK